MLAALCQLCKTKDFSDLCKKHTRFGLTFHSILTTALQLFSKAPSFLGLAHPTSVSTGQVEQWVCVNAEFMAQIPPPPPKKKKYPSHINT